jgi:hypothetical protein
MNHSANCSYGSNCLFIELRVELLSHDPLLDHQSAERMSCLEVIGCLRFNSRVLHDKKSKRRGRDESRRHLAVIHESGRLRRQQAAPEREQIRRESAGMSRT